MLLALTLALPAFAQTGEYSITITNTSTYHTYDVYQIFSGDISGTDTSTTGPSGYSLTNIRWGSSISDAAAFLAALKIQNSTKYDGCTDAADVAKKLVTADDLDAFLRVLNTGTHLGTAVKSQQAAGASTTIELSAAGYYLVKDTLAAGGENKFVSDYIVQVLGEEQMAPKGDVPEIKKEVKDINDSTDAGYGNWQKSADHDIGDKVPFLITATVCDDYANYDEYTFVIRSRRCRKGSSL